MTTTDPFPTATPHIPMDQHADGIHALVHPADVPPWVRRGYYFDGNNASLSGSIDYNKSIRYANATGNGLCGPATTTKKEVEPNIRCWVRIADLPVAQAEKPRVFVPDTAAADRMAVRMRGADTRISGPPVYTEHERLAWSACLRARVAESDRRRANRTPWDPHGE